MASPLLMLAGSELFSWARSGGVEVEGGGEGTMGPDGGGGGIEPDGGGVGLGTEGGGGGIDPPERLAGGVESGGGGIDAGLRRELGPATLVLVRDGLVCLEGGCISIFALFVFIST